MKKKFSSFSLKANDVVDFYLYECETCKRLYETELGYNSHISDPLNCKFKNDLTKTVVVSKNTSGDLEFDWPKPEPRN